MALVPSARPLLQPASCTSKQRVVTSSQDGLPRASRPTQALTCGTTALLAAAVARRGSQRSAQRRFKHCLAAIPDGELPPCACRSKLHGADVYIIGTAHISAKSAADVEALISHLEPDRVVVELSRERISSLYPAGATATESGSLQINLENTPQGFPVVVGHSEPSESSAEEGQLIVRGPSDKVDVVNMRRALSNFSESEWLERAFKKHRYQSESLQLLPAIEMLASLSTSLFPLAQRALYMSVGTVKHSGSEFAAAARCARDLQCPIILGDVENEDLFDPVGALEVTRGQPVWMRLAGPFVRPPEGGINLPKDWRADALKHVFAGTTKKGVGTQLLAANVVLTVYALVKDGLIDPSAWATPPKLISSWEAVAAPLLAMGMTNSLIAAIFMSLAGCGVDNNGRYEGRDNVTTMIEDDDEEDRRRWCCFWCRRG
eukprot:s917_g1.t1